MRIGTTDGDLYLDVRGTDGAPPLLYLHGGPGMGCREFMTWQGDRLATQLRVHGLDQRGVLRSDPLGADATLNENDLVADCERLREWLGIEHWAVLGHSFGARIALRYALRYPLRVNAVMFENPGWDLRQADRAKLLAAATLYDELDDPITARRCRDLAAGPLTERWEAVDLMTGLFERGRYFDMYAHLPESRAALNALDGDDPAPAAGPDGTVPDEDVSGDAHRRLLFDAPDLMDSMVPLLVRLKMPALLIRGAYDLAAGPATQAAFEDLVPDGMVEVFERSGHFAQLEEPDRYARLVTAFALRHRRG